MTPKEIKEYHQKVSVEEAQYLAKLLDQWMARNKQPSKDLQKVAEEMKKDGSSGKHITASVTASIVDWFAYGN